MIFDELENLAHYKGIHKHLDCAIDYLLTHDVNDYDSGRYEIAGEKYFCLYRKMNCVLTRQMNLNFIKIIWIYIFFWQVMKLFNMAQE